MRRMDGQGTALKSIPVKPATVNNTSCAVRDNLEVAPLRTIWLLATVLLRVIAAIWPAARIAFTLLAIAAWTAATLDWALGYGSWFGRPSLDCRPDQVKPFQMTANPYAMSVWTLFCQCHKFKLTLLFSFTDLQVG